MLADVAKTSTSVIKTVQKYCMERLDNQTPTTVNVDTAGCDCGF